MLHIRFVILLGLLLIAASLFVACGNRNQLQSMTITPAQADAQNYPNGQVQFTAAGTYANGNQVKPLTSLWTPGVPWSEVAWPGLTLTDAGLASCGTAKPGTYTIVATAPLDPGVPISQLSMTTPQLNGTTQLTCP